MEKRIKINANTTLQYQHGFNGILELTYKELQVLSRFIDLGDTVDLCSSSNKKIVAQDLHIKDHNTLNNYVKRLKDKGAIKKTKNGYELNPILVPRNKMVIEVNKT